MKKIKLLIAVSILCLASNKSKAQCWPDQSDAYWKIGPGFGSSRVSDCNPGYNCHGFIMSYFEPPQPCQPSPFNYYNPYPCPLQQGIKGPEWKTNGRYLKVCAEGDAKIAYYQMDHSAVRVVENGTTKYISKYGSDGPLVSHDLNDSWYHNDNNGSNRVISTEFWTYIGDMTGNNPVTGMASQSYSVLSGSGLSYSWSVISGVIIFTSLLLPIKIQLPFRRSTVARQYFR